MAAADWDAIETAARGVIEGDLGAVRVVTKGRLEPSLTAERSAIASILATKTCDRYELDVRDLGPHPGSPSLNHDAQLSYFEIRVMLWTKLQHPRRRKASRAERTRYAAATSRMVRDALEWPGNLDAGADAAPTEIIRGSIAQTSTTPIRVFGEAQVAEQILTFRGIVHETLPVS